MLVFIFEDNREGVLEKDYISRILSNWYFRYRDFIIENFIYFLEGVLRKLRVWNIFRAKSVQINSFRGEWRSFFQTWNEISSFRWRQIILRLNCFRHFRWQKLRIVGPIIAYFKRNLKDLERRKIVQISRFLHLRRYKSNGRNRSSKSSIPLQLEALNSTLPIRLPWRECLFEKRKDSRIWCFDESSSEIIRFPFFFFFPMNPITSQGIEILVEVNWFRWIRF